MDAASLGFDDNLAAFADSALGRGLPPDVEGLIKQAGLLRHLPEQALPLLQQARAAAPRHPAPVIALYRFYFYGHQLAQARAMGEDALAMRSGPISATSRPATRPCRNTRPCAFTSFSSRAWRT